MENRIERLEGIKMLTPHEHRVLALRRAGTPTATIAKMLRIKDQSVRNAIHAIYKKLGIARPHSTILARIDRYAETQIAAAQQLTDTAGAAEDLTFPHDL